MSEQCLRFLWPITVQSSALIVAVLILRLVFSRRMDKRLQYALWLPVLARLALPFAIESPLSVMNAVQPVTRAFEKTFVISEQQTAAGRMIPLAVSATGLNAPAADKAALEGIPWGDVLVWVWLAGFAVVAAATLFVNLRFYARVARTRTPAPRDRQLDELCGRLGIRRRPQVFVSGCVGSPCIMGVLRPCVILTPSAADDEASLRYILMHELTHIKKGDNITAVLRAVLCAVYWFNPLVWAASCCSHRDCELACDASVTRRLDQAGRLEYGMALISQLREGVQPFAAIQTAATLTMGKKEMLERIIMIKNNRKTSKWIIVCVCALLSAAMLAACTSYSGTGKPATGDEPPASDISEPIELIPFDQEPTQGVYLKVFPSEYGGGCGFYLPDDETQARLKALIDGFTFKDADYDTINAHVYSGIVVCCGGAEYYVYSDGFIDVFSYDIPGHPVTEGQDEFCETALAIARDELGLELFFDQSVITDIVSATYDYTYWDWENATVVDGEYRDMQSISGTQTITDPQALAGLSEFLRNAEDMGVGGAACGFGNILALTRSDGKVITIAVATDSCATYFVDGRYFDYLPEFESRVRVHDWFDEIPFQSAY